MKQSFSLLFMIVTNFILCQSFEGTLIYTSDIELSPTLEKSGVTKQNIIDKMKKAGTWPDSISISYKSGNYCNKPSDSLKSWIIYNSETNKIYSVKDGLKNEICTVIDASIDSEFAYFKTLPTVTKLDSTVTVNNIPCEIIRVKWKFGTYDYYYNSTMFKVNPELYSKHIYDGWYEFLKISNSLPIKIVKKGPGVMTISITLINSNTNKIDDSLFTIPELKTDNDLNIRKSPNSEIMRIK